MRSRLIFSMGMFVVAIAAILVLSIDQARAGTLINHAAPKTLFCVYDCYDCAVPGLVGNQSGVPEPLYDFDDDYSCGVNPASGPCSSHLCSAYAAANDALPAVRAAIAGDDADALVAILRRFPAGAVWFNRDRQALQFAGCTPGSVAMNLPVNSTRIAAAILESFGRQHYAE